MSEVPRAYLTRVGPFEHRNGMSIAMYLALSASAEVIASCTKSPPDDAAALRELAKRLSGYAPACSLELAPIGAQLGLDPVDLPIRLAEERAATSYLAVLSGHVRMGLGGPRELFFAGAEYLRTRPWENISGRDRFALQATLENHATGQSYRLPLRLHVRDGRSPDGPSIRARG